MNKVWWAIALCTLVVSGCARMRANSTTCTRDAAYMQGTRDASAGSSKEDEFQISCTVSTKDIARKAYREGFNATRAKHRAKNKTSEFDAEEALLDLPETRTPAGEEWICEVEASSKIFTGMGGNRDEALKSARSSCGSHLQASSCEKADCKKSL